MDVKIAVIGLGYVGLPVAIAFAEKFPDTIGFDINVEKLKELKQGVDRTGEVSKAELSASTLRFTHTPEDLRVCNFFVVAVPTPVDDANNPDLTPMILASKTVATVLKKGDIIVYESTVYPGVTEEVCGPLLEKITGLKSGVDFKLGYSPERINPGDKERTLTKIVKIVAGQDQATLDVVARTYEQIVQAGVHRASSIKVVEAAKVIENTQRDLNIALINELAIIFDAMGIPTNEVLEAAGTKWNFLKFKPGLVGGHCIGVDPYYLTFKAEQMGYHSQVITAGRRINDSMGTFVAQKALKMMLRKGLSSHKAKVGIMGLTFKENVSDIRNSKVPSILKELKDFGVDALISDAWASETETMHEYGLELIHEDKQQNLDVLILAVPHQAYLNDNFERVLNKLKEGSILIDIKSVVDRKMLHSSVEYWSL